jgi:hypothetical protein
MSRCKGTTRAGERCKRTALEGEDFCVAHVDQATGNDAAPAPGVGNRGRGDPGSDAVILVVAAAVAAFAVRRLFRLV